MTDSVRPSPSDVARASSPLAPAVTTAEPALGRRSGLTISALVILGALMIGIAGFSIWQWGGLEPTVQILLIGLFAIGALFFSAIVMLLASQRRDDRRGARRDAIYSRAFFETPRPQMITQNGQPALANRAYLETARRLGIDAVSDHPPAIDRLFATTEKGGAAAIFRLHHMADDTTSATEVLNMIGPDGQLSRYRLTVSRLNKAADRLWEVERLPDKPQEAESLARAPIGLFAATKDGRVLSTNATLDRWLGGPDALVPAHIDEFLEDPDILLGSEATHGKTVRSETRLITRKGVVTPTVLIARWHATDLGEMIASVALHGHSALRPPRPAAKADGAALRGKDVSAEARQAVSAFASVPFGVVQIDGADLAKAPIAYANRAMTEMTGREEIDGTPFLNLFSDPAVRARLAEEDVTHLAQSGPVDVQLSGPSGQPAALYLVPDADVPERVWAYLVDISARRSLEDQLRQSQKMQAIGQLAAGVAHDFNNLLTAIRLNTDELLQRHPVGDPSYPELQGINATGARAAALVKKLLAFSRRQTRRAERLDVSEALSDMYLTLKQTLGGQAQLTLNHGRNVPPVLADRSQFDNVIMNLCVNARDAMEAQGGGQITIESQSLDRRDVTDPGLRAALSAFNTDEIVVVSVADTGTGMTDEIKAKIFEPFFTTKEQGKGTGLGLATVYGIVQQSGGHLEVDSRLGHGTTFRIYMPAAGEADLAEAPPAPAPAPRKPADLAGQGNILFVEDEASVRVIAAKSLRKKGYKVVEAEDGEEALEILEDAEEPFDLLLSDVVMPGLDGPGLLKKGRPLLGEARIVFISGYAEEKFSDLLAEEPDVTFLPKPFTLAELAEKVKAEIGEAGAS